MPKTESKYTKAHYLKLLAEHAELLHQCKPEEANRLQMPRIVEAIREGVWEPKAE